MPGLGAASGGRVGLGGEHGNKYVVAQVGHVLALECCIL
jgi:hypothetical protein